MKKLFSFVLFLAPCIVFAQNGTPLKDTLLLIHGGNNLVDDSVLIRMIHADYNYVIAGTQSPTKGFDIETTSPSVSFSENFSLNKKKTISLSGQLGAGTRDNLSQILSGNKLSGAYSYALGLNFLLPKNAVAYTDTEIIKRRQYNFANLKIKHVLLQYDTAFVLHRLVELSKSDSSYNRFKDSVTNYLLKFNATIDKNNLEINANNIRGIISELIRRYAGNPDETETTTYNRLTRSNYYNEELDIDYKRSKDILNATKYSAALDDIEIGLMSNLWNRKDIKWINMSIGGNNNTFSVYDSSTAKKLIDTSNFLPSIKVSFNWLVKYRQPGAYFYWDAGAGISSVSSIDELSKINYQTRENFGAAGTTTIIRTQSGTAYKGASVTGFGWNIFAELYYKGFFRNSTGHNNVPGIYFKTQYSYGNPWINQYKLATYVGLIFNVNNKNKTRDRNRLTIIPYIGSTDLLADYKDPAKTIKNTFGDLLVGGLKVGVPLF